MQCVISNKRNFVIFSICLVASLTLFYHSFLPSSSSSSSSSSATFKKINSEQQQQQTRQQKQNTTNEKEKGDSSNTTKKQSYSSSYNYSSEQYQRYKAWIKNQTSYKSPYLDHTSLQEELESRKKHSLLPFFRDSNNNDNSNMMNNKITLPCNVVPLALGCDCYSTSSTSSTTRNDKNNNNIHDDEEAEDSGCLFLPKKYFTSSSQRKKSQEQQQQQQQQQQDKMKNKDFDFENNPNCAIRIALVGDSHTTGYDAYYRYLGRGGYDEPFAMRVNFNLNERQQQQQKNSSSGECLTTKTNTNKNDDENTNTRTRRKKDKRRRRTKVKIRRFAKGMTGLVGGKTRFQQTEEYRDALLWQPHIVILLFGTNDALSISDAYQKQEEKEKEKNNDGDDKKPNAAVKNKKKKNSSFIFNETTVMTLLFSAYMTVMKSFASLAKTQQIILVTPPPVLPECSKLAPHCKKLNLKVLQNDVVNLLRRLSHPSLWSWLGCSVQLVDANYFVSLYTTTTNVNSKQQQQKENLPTSNKKNSNNNLNYVLKLLYQLDGVHLTPLGSRYLANAIYYSICEGQKRVVIPMLSKNTTTRKCYLS